MTVATVRDIEDDVHRRVLAAGRASRDAVRPDEVHRLVREVAPLLPNREVDVVVARVLARTGGLGALEPLLADPAVTEVMVNGPGPVWVERAGRLARTDVELDRATIELLLLRIVTPLGLRVDRSSPLVDARLPDGSRVNAIVPPLAVDGPCLTIRRFGIVAIDLDAIAAPPVAALLRQVVAERRNVVISGGTGAGKTTLLNAMAASIPQGERIVTVEDAAELRLPGEHVVRLEARPASVEGAGEVTIRDLVRNALRMRPDRLIVGEARGPEALDLLQAMNTGHDGSLSTCHANGPDDALRRLETMVLTGAVALPLVAVREQIASAVDVVVHVARRLDGSRRVRHVAEVRADPAGGLVRTRPLADGERVLAAPARAVTPCAGAGCRSAAVIALVVAASVVGLATAARRARTTGLGQRARRRIAPAGPGPSRHLQADGGPRWLVRSLERAGVVRPAPAEVWRAWTVGGAFLAMLASVLSGPVLGLLVAVGATFAPPAVLWTRRDRGAARYEEALPVFLDEVAAELRAGSALVAALGRAAERTAGSLGGDVSALVVAVDRGGGLVDQLDRWREQRPLPGVELTAAALAIGSTTGGRQTGALAAVAETVRDRIASRREAAALATQSRASALVMSVTPLLFAVGASSMDPAVGHVLVHTPVGLACLLVGGGLDAVAAVWMARITGAGS